MATSFITVACQPARLRRGTRKAWDDDVAAFESAPGRHGERHRPAACFDQTFAAKLASDQMETVFMVPVTNYADVIAKRQAKGSPGEPVW
ncbi:hypothetical protein [Streptomyces sp. KL116D]|uniref:hypothetical protein n=1 Tax=Streptomyces sp. KL116D TaxID=3045152 RepID=UPI003558FD66